MTRNSSITLADLIRFAEAHRDEAEKARRCQIASEEDWRSATDDDDRVAAGIATAMTRRKHPRTPAAERQRLADSEKRIAAKYERDVLMFDRIIEELRGRA